MGTQQPGVDSALAYILQWGDGERRASSLLLTVRGEGSHGEVARWSRKLPENEYTR